MPKHSLLFLFVLFFSSHHLSGQSTAKKVSLQDFKLKTDNIDSKGRKGLKLEFGVLFNWTNDIHKENTFTLTWRVEDSNGKVIHNSDGQAEYMDSKLRIRASNSFQHKNPPYMLDKFNSIDLPFEFLDLTTGPQKLTLVLSLENDAFQFSDFAQEKLQFQYTKIEAQPFSAQVLTVEDLRFSHNKSGFAVNEPGLDISFRLRPKYDQKETKSTSYTIYWLLRDLQGNVVFDSRKSASIHHQDEHVYFRSMEKGAFRRTTGFSRYNDIRLAGPGKAEVVLIAEDEAKESKEIYAAVHDLDLPVKYKFAEQKFTVEDLVSSITTRKGVQGLRLNFDLKFDKSGPRFDPELGNYFVYMEIRDAGGNIIFSPKKLKHDLYSSAILAYGCDAYSDKGRAQIELFVPWYRMELPAGKTHLQYSLRVSDQKRQVKFPELSKGGRVATAPQLRKYTVNLTELRMVEGDYDVEFLKTGSHLPDLQWTLQAGRDDLYRSKQINNTLSAPTGLTTVTLAEGDVLSLVLYDIDSGFFNRSDWLGRWEIPFMEHTGGFVFEKEKDGKLAKLRVQVSLLK